MKRILLVLSSVFCAMSAVEAQNSVPAVDTIRMYGVDYSRVKVIGAEESETKFVRIFEEINGLFLSQPEKYDCSDMIWASVTVDIEPICRRILSADYSDMKLQHRGYASSLDVAEAVADYRLPDARGVGMVFIAELLDKGRECGTYYVVCFDIASRDVLFCRKVETKAGGFGLRNYWANTVYQIIRKIKIK